MRTNIVRCPVPKRGGGSLSQHSVKFLNEQIYRRVRIGVRHRSAQIRSGDFHLSLGGEHPQLAPEFTNDIDPQTDDARFVSEKPSRFAFEREFHGVSEMEMDAAKEQRCGMWSGFTNSHGNIYLKRREPRGLATQ